VARRCEVAVLTNNGAMVLDLLPQAMPRLFGDVSDEERRQYGRVLDQFTATSTERSAGRSSISALTTCCSSCLDSGWSR